MTEYCEARLYDPVDHNLELRDVLVNGASVVFIFECSAALRQTGLSIANIEDMAGLRRLGDKSDPDAYCASFNRIADIFPFTSL